MYTLVNASLFTTKTEKDKRPFEVFAMQLAHTSDLSFLLHIKTNASYHLGTQTQQQPRERFQTRLEKHMTVAALFMTCSWTLTKRRFHSQSEAAAAAEMICWGRGTGRRDLDGRKCGEGVCDEHEKHLFIVT